ncbi:tetratricopeptide repeat protein [Candidatus Woesearchaeota archaeon]|nr:tetratricopeptide repeat protein [Candidatus Woesearchaeota archaeon]
MRLTWKKLAAIALVSGVVAAIPIGLSYAQHNATQRDFKNERKKELEAILLEAKADLKANTELDNKYDIDLLISKISPANFPFDDIDNFLENVGIPAYSIKIPQIIFDKFEDSDVAGRYKDGIMYTNPDTLLLGIKEGIVHEYIHSKGKLDNQLLNEGFVQYITMKYIGTSVRSYSAEVYLVNNLAYILGYIKNKDTTKKEKDIIKEGIRIIGKSFSNNSMKEIEDTLSYHEKASGLLSFKKDELDALRFLFNMEEFLRANNTSLKGMSQYGVDISVFDYFDVDFDKKEGMKESDVKKQRKEKREKAIEELEGMIAKNPAFESSLHFKIALGNLYLKENNYEKAAKNLEEVLENKYKLKTKFSNDVLRLNLGFAYQKLKQPEKAIANYREISLKSGHSFMIVKARYLMAQTFFENGDTDNAVKTYESIKNFKAFNEENFVKDYIVKSYYDLSNIYANKKEFDKALNEFSRLIELYPGSMEATDSLLRKAEIYEELDDIGNAILNYETLINKWPELYISSVSRVNLANILIENDEYDKAIDYLIDVLRYHPKTKEAEEADKILQTFNATP